MPQISSRNGLDFDDELDVLIEEIGDLSLDLLVCSIDASKDPKSFDFALLTRFDYPAMGGLLIKGGSKDSNRSFRKGGDLVDHLAYLQRQGEEGGGHFDVVAEELIDM